MTRCYPYHDIVVGTNGPEISVSLNGGTPYHDSEVSFLCTGARYIIDLANDNDVPVDVVYYTRINVMLVILTVVIFSGVGIALSIAGIKILRSIRGKRDGTYNPV